MPLPDSPEAVVKARSDWWARQIGRSFRRLTRRHFNQLRIAHWGLPQVTTAPLAICSNHPGWWDPVTFLLLHQNYFRHLASFGPMEQTAFARYPFFRKIGIFGIEPDSASGGRRFLQVAKAVYATGKGCLWVTGQGHFADVRSPVALKSGLARMAAVNPQLTILPLAIEYSFWQEKLPEMLVAFGQPLKGCGDATDWQTALTTELQRTMQRLASDVMSRDPGRFATLLQGAQGVGGLYDFVRRTTAMLQGRRFQAAHDGN